MNQAGTTRVPSFFPPEQPWVKEDGQLILLGSACGQCGRNCFPPADVCAFCGTTSDLKQARIPARGVLYTCSRVSVAPTTFHVPYTIGYIDLADDVRVFAHLAEPAGGLALGDEVAGDLDVIGTVNDSPLISLVFHKVGAS